MISFESNLVNENGNLLWLQADFYYYALKIEFDGQRKSCDNERSDDGAHYIYEKMENMILVEMNSETDTNYLLQKNILQKTKSKDITLLDSMLKLRTRLKDNTFSNPTMLLDNDSTLLTEEEIDTIIKWCSRNGYPFEIPYKEFEKQNKQKKQKKRNLFEAITRDQKRFGFKVGDFLISLNNLYCCYKMYSVLSNESDSIKEHLFLIDDKEPFDSTEQHDKTVDKCKGLFDSPFEKIALPYKDLSDEKLTVDDYKELFKRQFNKIPQDKSASIDNDYVAQSLFDAALYQLALIMYDDEKEIRICKCCRERFVQKKPRAQYCDKLDCYPQKHHAQKIRAAKRKSTNRKKAKTI